MTRRKVLQLVMLLIGLLAASQLLKWIVYTGKRPNLDKLKAMEPLIAELVETIIPATDTPGAREAGVADFVIGKVIFHLARREQNFFIDGLADVERLAWKDYRNTFIKCRSDQKLEILNYLERQQLSLHPILVKVKNRIFGFSFIEYLKAYTVEGYCTSELGATHCLVYDRIPLEYQPCLRLRPGQRSWATK